MTCPCCNPCSGPCDGETPCPESCACVGGQCVADACLPGYECVGMADCELDYCELVDGEWVTGVLGDPIPCPECPDGWDTWMVEYPAPWDPAVTLRFYECTKVLPADYATCCSPNAPRFQNGNLSECATDVQFEQETGGAMSPYFPCNWGYGCEEIALP